MGKKFEMVLIGLWGNNCHGYWFNNICVWCLKWNHLSCTSLKNYQIWFWKLVLQVVQNKVKNKLVLQVVQNKVYKNIIWEQDALVLNKYYHHVTVLHSIGLVKVFPHIFYFSTFCCNKEKATWKLNALTRLVPYIHISTFLE